MGLYIVVHMSLVVISMFLRALNMSNFINILMTLLFAETFAYLQNFGLMQIQHIIQNIPLLVVLFHYFH